jgi:Ca-activated chloride channel family protein
MPFLAPLALLGLVFVPAVLAMYLLKLRRDETVVPSTLLWQRLVADVEANAPWQRLRRSLLLLLQLLLVLVLVILAARPFLERPASLARDLVLVIDASASMAATDVAPDRMTAAHEAATAILADLPAGGRVSVIAAGRTARVVANDTGDLTRVREAIGGITPEPASGDLGDALRLASALAARSGDAQVVVVSDAAFEGSPSVRVDAPVRAITVGRDRQNQAVVALAVRASPSAVTRSVFVSLANTDIEAATRRLELWGDGRLLEARSVFMDPQSRTDLSIDDVPRDVSIVEVRLTAADGATGTPADHLAIDDRAWAVVPPDRLRRILLVSDGDPYLETALSYLPDAESYGVTPEQYGPGTKPDLFDLIIFEGSLPDTLPATAVLAIAPPSSSDLGTVTGRLVDPGIGSLDPSEPVLRYVDLSTTHVSEARQLELPAWARSVIPGPKGAPLLYIGDRDGRPTAVLAFEPRRSDLPLQVGFPILLANLTGELLGGSAIPTQAIEPGTPLTLAIPAGASGLRVERPDGSVDDLTRPAPDAPSVVFSRTDLLGVYTVTPIGLDASADPSAQPSSGGSATPAGSIASPAASAGTSPAAGQAGPADDASPGPVDPNEPIRFAVDLFDVAESTIAPGSAAAIEALGTPASGGAAADRPPVRDELWVPIVLLALLLLTLEWLVYERDVLARLRLGIGRRSGIDRGLGVDRARSGSGAAGGRDADADGRP